VTPDVPAPTVADVEAGGTPQLDGIFAALASPARRTMLSRLAVGPASVSELAGLVAMSQPAVSKNLKVLEHAGLISRGREAQRRPRALRPEALTVADDWVSTLRRSWEARLDRFGAYLAETAGDPKAPPRDPAVGHPPADHRTPDHPTNRHRTATATEE
jgi:DNA-binding transcriptional ArsR family regulator